MKRTTDNLITQFSVQANESQLKAVRDRVAAAPDDPLVLDWGGFVLYSAGDHEGASELYKQLVFLRENPSDHYYLGNCFYILGDEPSAVRHWRRVLVYELEGTFANRALEKLRRVAENEDAVYSVHPPRPKD